MKPYQYTLHTAKQGFFDITGSVREAIARAGLQNGLCTVWCPHTTAAVTVNENGDPDVLRDLLLGVDRAFPDRDEFRHFEGNSAAHLKSSALGCSLTLIVQDGSPLLGRWQSVYFCEFDGPRTRTYYIKPIKEAD